MINKIWSIYRITNKINNKIYIGQAADVSKRWYDHRAAVRLNKPKQIIHRAMIKHGIENFDFEVIACCLSQEDANETETICVTQYNSYIKNGHGYNSTFGGYNAPKTEEWKQSMRNWHASMSEEGKEKRREMSRRMMTNLIKTKGHPGLGLKRTPEQLERLKQARLNNPVEYTPEIRKKMSDSHIGKSLPEEQRQKMSEGIKKNWDERNAARFATGEIKCSVPDCNIQGKAKYRIINEIRYCPTHALRMLRHGSTDKLPAHKNIGQEPPNKIKFTDEQINIIMNSGLSIVKLSKQFGVTEKVITRVKKEMLTQK